MDLGARHWSIALAAALAVHLFLLFLFEHPAEPVVAEQGILIELGGGGGARGGNSAPQGLSPFNSEDSAEVLKALELAAVSEVRAEDLDTLEQETSAGLAVLAETVAEPNREPASAESPAPEKPEILARPKPKPKKQAKARSAQRKDKASEQPRDGTVVKNATSKVSSIGGERKAATNVGAGGAGSGSGVSVSSVKTSYAGLISAWLNRNKRYPKRARRLGHQGSVTVRFTVDRNGNVLSSNIVRSSGHDALDDEVRALMRRGRMPRMPADMKQARITMTVPIQFRLR